MRDNSYHMCNLYCLPIYYFAMEEASTTLATTSIGSFESAQPSAAAREWYRVTRPAAKVSDKDCRDLKEANTSKQRISAAVNHITHVDSPPTYLAVSAANVVPPTNTFAADQRNEANTRSRRVDEDIEEEL